MSLLRHGTLRVYLLLLIVARLRAFDLVNSVLGIVHYRFNGSLCAGPDFVEVILKSLTLLVDFFINLVGLVRLRLDRLRLCLSFANFLILLFLILCGLLLLDFSISSGFDLILLGLEILGHHVLLSLLSFNHCLSFRLLDVYLRFSWLGGRLGSLCCLGNLLLRLNLGLLGSCLCLRLSLHLASFGLGFGLFGISLGLLASF